MLGCAEEFSQKIMFNAFEVGTNCNTNIQKSATILQITFLKFKVKNYLNRDGVPYTLKGLEDQLYIYSV